MHSWWRRVLSYVPEMLLPVFDRGRRARAPQSRSADPRVELEKQVTLLGHVAREQMACYYDRADVVVLTSRSEGIPLVLMEAMARGKIVLAPAITGIPELVIAGKTGFLYEPGSSTILSRSCSTSVR